MDVVCVKLTEKISSIFTILRFSYNTLKMSVSFSDSKNFILIILSKKFVFCLIFI